jgi:hypothetical protein
MSALIFIAGLVIGITAFLYMFSVIAEGLKKTHGKSKTRNRITEQKIEPDNIGFRNRRLIPPGKRVCPLCCCELTKYEGLYATKVIENGDKKILIMGCKYCFKDK